MSPHMGMSLSDLGHGTCCALDEEILEALAEQLSISLRHKGLLWARMPDEVKVRVDPNLLARRNGEHDGPDRPP